ncbi:MAG: hypothetical protein R3C28_18335 [Pirellulaceae bacterium]
MWIGILLVVQGVVITAMNTPHGHGHKKNAGHDKPPAEVTSAATEANH